VLDVAGPSSRRFPSSYRSPVLERPSLTLFRKSIRELYDAREGDWVIAIRVGWGIAAVWL
jgi:hypothetical protein